MRTKNAVCLLILLVMAFTSVSYSEDTRVLRLATTTSTENSGLLDHLLPDFEKKYGIKVHVIAVGTGKALKLSENGDVDLVMVHAPEAELKFVEAGYGVNRRPFMKNDFVILGPPADPAKLKGAGDLKAALDLLGTSEAAVFVSRGDDSGTHKKELLLWPGAGGPPPASRYLEIGQGMEAALRMADEKRAYTLCDRGTYLALGKTLNLVVVFEGSEKLDNPYSVIATNPALFPDANYMDAMLMIAWLTCPEGQAKIGGFEVDGQALFHPAAVPSAGE
jgi:tungstate transport system substrate-binding protein